MNTNLQSKIRSLNTTDGEVLLFTAIPDQYALAETMNNNPCMYGWEGDDEGLEANPSQEYTEWLEARVEQETKNATAYYTTIVPQGYTLQDVFETQVFDKFLEKCFEEETGWLYELRTGHPETFVDNDAIIVLNFDEDYERYEDLQLGVITPKCI